MKFKVIFKGKNDAVWREVEVEVDMENKRTGGDRPRQVAYAKVPHFELYCSCGELIAACRCPGAKVRRDVVHGCTRCQISINLASYRISLDSLGGQVVDNAAPQSDLEPEGPPNV